jgi:opacity protein-like surface antigen
MNAMKLVLPVAMAGAMGVASPVFAQETSSSVASHLYVGANGGQAHWRFCPTTGSCDDTNGTLGVFAGYHINHIFSAEIGFRNYGEDKGPTATIKGKAWELSGLAAWPIVGALSVYGRLGLHRSVLKGDGALTGVKETTGGPTYGLGVALDASKNVTLRAEWQSYAGLGGSTMPKGDINVVTVGALWRFQ